MKPLGDMTLAGLIAAIASTDPAPGCGAAAGAALGLAAACARKAVRIAATHDAAAQLGEADRALAGIAAAALAAGDTDAAHFESLIHALRRPADAAAAAEKAALADAAGRALHLVALLRAELSAVRPLVPARLAGDLDAAMALADAVAAIERRNLRET